MKFIPAEEISPRPAPEVAGLKLLYTHNYVFVQELAYAPELPMKGLYKTAERRRGRLYDAEYETTIISIKVSHRWSDEKQAWWGSGMAHMRILKPNGEPYESGWRAELIRYSPGGHPSQRDENTDAFIKSIIEATTPKTKITVTEEPV